MTQALKDKLIQLFIRSSGYLAPISFELSIEDVHKLVVLDQMLPSSSESIIDL